MKKKILIILFLLLFLLILFNFLKNGNNKTNQDKVNNIFNMTEYEAEIDVTIKSNKNENKYIIKQSYNKKQNEIIQEIISPENLKGIKITQKEKTLTIENAELNLSKIFENYNPITQNDMDLETFIEDYKNNKGIMQETDEEFIYKASSKSNNKYTKNKTLYINKSTETPTKMIIKDMNENTTVYIVYNKVEIKN